MPDTWGVLAGLLMFCVGLILGSAAYTGCWILLDRWQTRKRRRLDAQQDKKNKAKREQQRWDRVLRDFDRCTEESLWGFEFGFKAWPRNATQYIHYSHPTEISSTAVASVIIRIPTEPRNMLLGDL